MNKRHLHHLWTKTRWIRPIYFLLIAIVSTGICVLALRSNNEHMIQLRSAVYSADKNNTDVTGTLKQLQAYVTTHMNTDLSSGNGTVYPPIQLKYTYDRILAAQSQDALTVNSQLYTEAQTYCQQQDAVDFSGRNRVPCIEQFVLSHDTKLPNSVPVSLYEFDFVSPVWSPDLAGWSMVIAATSVILFLLTFTIHRLFKRYN